jgi:hypothetical protein
MGKLRVLLVIIAFFVVAFAVGQRWKLKPETAANRAVQRGEIAVLVNSNNAPVWLCLRKEDAYPMQEAMTTGNVSFLERAASERGAFALEAGERVKVLEESVDKRRVEVQAGPHAGKTGWLEYEYLRPVRSYER